MTSLSDDRCCGSGVCIINAQGECWCGQRWDGEKMCRPPLEPVAAASPAPEAPGAVAGGGARQLPSTG